MQTFGFLGTSWFLLRLLLPFLFPCTGSSLCTLKGALFNLVGFCCMRLPRKASTSKASLTAVSIVFGFPWWTAHSMSGSRRESSKAFLPKVALTCISVFGYASLTRRLISLANSVSVSSFFRNLFFKSERYSSDWSSGSKREVSAATIVLKQGDKNSKISYP